MKTYFEARRERMKHNHDALIQLAADVVVADNNVTPYMSTLGKLPENLVFINHNDDTMVEVIFTEVPFQWIGPQPINGYLHNHAMPYTVTDILQSLTPIEKTMRYDDAKSLLEWRSYLTQVDMENVEL